MVAMSDSEFDLDYALNNYSIPLVQDQSVVPARVISQPPLQHFFLPMPTTNLTPEEQYHSSFLIPSYMQGCDPAMASLLQGASALTLNPHQLTVSPHELMLTPTSPYANSYGSYEDDGPPIQSDFYGLSALPDSGRHKNLIESTQPITFLREDLLNGQNGNANSKVNTMPTAEERLKKLRNRRNVHACTFCRHRKVGPLIHSPYSFLPFPLFLFP